MTLRNSEKGKEVRLMPEYDHLYVRQGLEELEQVRASIRASISMTKMSRFPC